MVRSGIGAGALAIAAGVVALTGCEPGASSPAPDAAPPDAAPPESDAAPPPACYEPSREAEIEPRPSTIASCAIWNNLNNLGGRVLVVRDRGQLAIEFAGNVEFRGSVEDGLVSLEYVHAHMLSEQCRWRVTETLSGTLDPDTCTMELGYRYRGEGESPGTCANPCAATASVSLELKPL
jgi:hypothetical protein